MLAATRSQIILMLAPIPFCALFPPTSCPYGIALLTREGSNNSDVPGQENVGGDDCQLSVDSQPGKRRTDAAYHLDLVASTPQANHKTPLMIISRLSLLPHRRKNNSTHLMQRIERS
jgi:hypothetical protein